MNRVSVLTIALLVFLLLAYKLNQPFWGHHEFNGVFHGMLAKNHLRYGIIQSRFARITNLYPTPREEWNFHAHRPSTYTVFLAILYNIFGTQEAIARLPSILASVVGIIILGKLMNEVFSKSKYLWIAILPILFTPLFRYYGSMPVFEPLLLPVIIFGLYSYWLSFKKQDNYGFIFASIIAIFIDWSGFWLPMWLFIFELFSKKRRRVLINLVSSTLLSLLIIFVQFYISYGSFNSLFKQAGFRLAFINQPYTPLSWIRLLGARSRAFWGDPILLAVFIGFLYVFVKGKRHIKLLFLTSLGIGVTHIFVFRNFTWYHDYMIYHTIPFIGLSLGAFAEVIYKKTRFKAASLFLVMLVTIATYIDTRVFFRDLSNLQPHKDCVEMGKRVKESSGKLIFFLNSEKAKECPPFIGFYGGKEFEIVIEE